jgi:hypothetical protein
MCKCRCGCVIATKRGQDLCRWCEGVLVFGKLIVKHTGE